MGARTVTSKATTRFFSKGNDDTVRRAHIRAAVWFSAALLLIAAPLVLPRVDVVVLALVLSTATAVLGIRALTASKGAGTMMVIGTGSRATALAAVMETSPSPSRLAAASVGDGSGPGGLNVLHVPTVRHAAEMLPRISCSRIVLAHDTPAPISLPLDARGKRPQVVATHLELQRILGRVPLDTLERGALIQSEAATSRHYQMAKRAADLLIAVPLGALILLGLPLLWLAIRLDSPGPLFYSQTRVGRDGTLFRIYKFRSMRTDAERNGPVWAAANDARVTRVGKFLRSTRIDELPQVWNIVRGDMSLVGPRPERPEFTAIIEEECPAFALRTAVKPGVTGWAQICAGYGRSVTDARTKLEYDLFYVAHHSLLLDAKILLKTVPVIIGRKGS